MAFPVGLGLWEWDSLCGGWSRFVIARGRGELPDSAQSLGFSREQTPCVAMLHQVFRRLDVDAFKAVLGRWSQGCR